MIGLCYYFGGFEDLERAQKLERLLKDAGKEIPESFERDCLEQAALTGSCDYLGRLFGLAVDCIAEDIRDGLSALVERIDTEYFPNYIASSGNVDVWLDSEFIESQKDYEQMLEALYELKRKYDSILKEFFIELAFHFNDESYTLDELISLFEKKVKEGRDEATEGQDNQSE